MNTSASTERNAVDDLQKRVVAINSGMQRSNLITVALGVVAMVMLLLYFNHAYGEIVALTKPDTVVSLVDNVLSDNLPVARETLREQIMESSPEWAATLSEHAQASIPELREQLEIFVMDQVDEQLAEVELMSDKEFRNFILENKDDLRLHAKLLSEDKQVPDEMMNELVEAFDSHFEVSFEETTAILYETMFELNKKLMRLKASQNLTPDEQQERRLIMLAKAVQGPNKLRISSETEVRDSE